MVTFHGAGRSKMGMAGKRFALTRKRITGRDDDP
jgi:hypothetical protein